jgi:hypothetical protein
MCRCHQKDGIKTLHVMACCRLTYMKYINPDGSVDEIALKKFREEAQSIPDVDNNK